MNSLKATHFRIWATNTLREFMVKGFVLDDQMLKNGRAFGQDYFDELLERSAKSGLTSAVPTRRSPTSGTSVTLKFLRRRLLLGLAGSLLLGRLLADLIVGADATDLLVLAGGALLLLAIRAVACYVAARRAASVDPMIALRQDQDHQD